MGCQQGNKLETGKISIGDLFETTLKLSVVSSIFGSYNFVQRKMVPLLQNIFFVLNFQSLKYTKQNYSQSNKKE